MNSFRTTLAAGAAAIGLAACTGNQTAPPTPTSVNVASASQSGLQFAVGTANIGGTATGMNVLAMLRQSNGLSSVLVSTPKLTGPFVFNVAGQANPDGVYDASSTADLGPSTAEVAGNYIGGSPQSVASAATASTPYTTFGTAGGLFGNGFAPANYTANGVPFSFNPYQEPLYAGTGNQATITPWGGPPAYDPLGNGTGTLNATGTSQFCESGVSLSGCTRYPGIPLGLNVFQGVTAGAGAYALAVQIPTGGTGSTTVSATDTAAPVLLPTIAAPTVAFTNDAKKGADAAISYVLPAGVVGAYVQVADFGPANPDYPTVAGQAPFLGDCNGGSTVYYTFWVTASGTSTITSAYGPNAGTGPAICNAAYYAAAGTTSPSSMAPLPTDTLQIQIIGFDYNQYALQYSSGTTQVQTPKIPATADITMSKIAFYPNPGAAYLTAVARKAVR
jgi:hypothetical protein